MTKEDKVFGTIFLISRLHEKKLLSLAKVIWIARSRRMLQSLPNLYEQVNSGLYYGNPDFNFNVDAENPCLI